MQQDLKPQKESSGTQPHARDDGQSTISLPLAKAPSLHRNTGVLLAGNMIYAFCQWLLVFMLVKFCDAEMVGRFVLGLAIAVPLYTFFCTATRPAQVTDSLNEYKAGHYVGLRIVAAFASFTIAVCIVLMIGYSAFTARIIIGVCFFKAFEAIADVYYGVLQKHDQFGPIALSRISRGVGTVVVAGAALYFLQDMVWALTGLAVLHIALLLQLDIPAASRCGGSIKPFWNGIILKKLAWHVLPLSIAAMLNQVWFQLPRYYLQANNGLANLGIFAALSVFALAEMALIDSAIKVATPSLARHYSCGNRRAMYRIAVKILLALIGICLLLFLGFWHWGEKLLLVFYGPEYAAHVDVLHILLASGVIWCLSAVCSLMITCMRKFSSLLPIQVIIVIGCVLLANWLIPRYGIVGAAWVVFGSSAFSFVCNAAFMIWFLTKKSTKALSSSCSGVEPNGL